MVMLDRIYTRGGDAGETSLGDGTRIAKTAPLIAAIGSVDEANATLGLARLHMSGEDDAAVARIQNDLFDVGGDLCVPMPQPGAEPRRALRVTDAQVLWLEGEIDRRTERLSPLTSFVLPGGSPASAYLHLARTVTRRAERDALAAASAGGVNPIVVRYLNRLSDLLFVLGRDLNGQGAGDVLWVPGANR